MNISFLPLQTPGPTCERIQQKLETITTQIRQLQGNTTQGKLLNQALAWGWTLGTPKGKHPLKVTRPGYPVVVIPGHGKSAPIQRGLALSILKALAKPCQDELQQLLTPQNHQISSAHIQALQQQIYQQEQRIQELVGQVNYFQTEAETGLALAAEIELRNTQLSCQITDLQHQRLELDATKRKVMGLIKERQAIEAKFELFTADFEQLEQIIDQVALFALQLPQPEKTRLLEILSQF